MKKFTKISMATALVASALTPVAAFAAEGQAPAGFYNVKTGDVVNASDFTFLSPQEKVAILTNATKDYYFLDGSGKALDPSALLSAKTNEDVEAAQEDVSAVENRHDVKFTEDGKVEVVQPGLTIESVSAINATGVEVTFPEVTEAIEDANVVVKDGEGNVVPTEAKLLAEGETSAEFAFTTPFKADHEFTGVWTVNGEKYSFDAINQLSDIVVAVTKGNQIDLQSALDAAGITYAEETRIADYLSELREDGSTATLESVQKAITKVDEAAATITEKEAAVDAVAKAKTQAQLLKALKDNFKLVNPDWIVNYANPVVEVDGEATAETAGNADLLAWDIELETTAAENFDEIQELVYVTNLAKVAPKVAAANMSLDSKKVTEAKTLVSDWIPAYDIDDADAPVPFAGLKEQSLDLLSLEDALIAVDQAKTNSALKVALVNLDKLETELIEKYPDAGFEKEFDIETVEDANLTAYRNALKEETEVGAKNQRKDIQKIVDDVNLAAEGTAKENVLADLNKVDSKTSVATVVALLEKSQEVHADDLKAAEATVNRVNSEYAEAYKRAALAPDTGLVGETTPTAEEVNTLIGDVNDAQDALNGIVDTNEELLAALDAAAEPDSKLKTITLEKSIEVDKDTIKLTSGVVIEGNNHTLYVGGAGTDLGGSTAEGISVVKGAKDVVIKNLEVRGTHGDNLIEIYGSATLDNVTALGGKKAGIYVNNDGTDTITVNFKDITTGGNAWDAGIGLLSQQIGSKVIANFSGTNSFGESVAVYTDDVNKYKGQYEVNGLEGYEKNLVVDKDTAGKVIQTQWKWTKASK